MTSLPNIFAVDEYSALPFFEIIKSVEEAQYRRFACSRFAHKSDRWSLWHFEGNTIQCSGSSIVRKANVFWVACVKKGFLQRLAWLTKFDFPIIYN